jgi:hypothetical protein
MGRARDGSISHFDSQALGLAINLPGSLQWRNLDERVIPTEHLMLLMDLLDAVRQTAGLNSTVDHYGAFDPYSDLPSDWLRVLVDCQMSILAGGYAVGLAQVGASERIDSNHSYKRWIPGPFALIEAKKPPRIHLYLE